MKKIMNSAERRIQGKLNANKAETIQSLKVNGRFVECCPEKGFVYHLPIVAYGEKLTLVIGLKNGEISLLQTVRVTQRVAV